MKKYFTSFLLLIFVALGFNGCSFADYKVADLSVIYGVTALLSLLLLIGCRLLVRQKRVWFILLFSSVLVVNTGYTLLSVSSSLEMALWANRLSYLGSVFLPFTMLMIILNVTSTKHSSKLHGVLGVVALFIFLIAATPGISPIYYKEVSLVTVDGVSALEKVYGPLHTLYLVYLLGYFSAMVTIIIRSYVKKTIGSTSHAVIIAIAVFVNIGVWLIEQISHIEFEFLSISYIISELFLLGVHLVMNENNRLRELVIQKDEVLRATSADNDLKKFGEITSDEKELFAQGLKTLTHTENEVYKFYLNGKSTKEIMAELNISENTLKFHNKNLYGKLGVSSRKQLLAVYRSIKADMSANGENAKIVIE